MTVNNDLIDNATEAALHKALDAGATFGKAFDDAIAAGREAEAGVIAPHMVGRTANGSCEQMADAFLKNLILW